jgi:hypothetical protein
VRRWDSIIGRQKHFFASAGSSQLLGCRPRGGRGGPQEDRSGLVSVVVSDTSPLHYLILCGAEAVLPRLFERVVIPPTVFAELQ